MYFSYYSCIIFSMTVFPSINIYKNYESQNNPIVQKIWYD